LAIGRTRLKGWLAALIAAVTGLVVVGLSIGRLAKPFVALAVAAEIGTPRSPV